MHLWQIDFRYEKASKDITIEFTLRNIDVDDNEVVVYTKEHRATEIDSDSGFASSVSIITIADSTTLPPSSKGYELLVRANGEVNEFGITRITRISYHKD